MGNESLVILKLALSKHVKMKLGFNFFQDIIVRLGNQKMVIPDWMSYMKMMVSLLACLPCLLAYPLVLLSLIHDPQRGY